MNRQKAREITAALAGINRTEWEALKRDVDMQLGRKAMRCVFQPEGDEGKPIMGWPEEEKKLEPPEGMEGWDALSCGKDVVRYQLRENPSYQIQKIWMQQPDNKSIRLWVVLRDGNRMWEIAAYSRAVDVAEEFEEWRCRCDEGDACKSDNGALPTDGKISNGGGGAAPVDDCLPIQGG